MLLRMAFVLELTGEESQQLLKTAHRTFLNVKEPRDQEIHSSLAAGMDLDEIDAVLKAAGLQSL